MTAYRALAPAKVNLGLFLGGVRESDGRHELVSVMQSISLADELILEPGPADAAHDELSCPGVPGPAGENLAAVALAAFRARTGWDAPPLRLAIAKRIPVAAGLGGGSADAAAALRLAMRASGLGDRGLLWELASELGADVPAQISPGRWLAGGAGERLQELPPPSGSLGLLVLPLAAQLSTAEVYGEADRLGLARDPGELRRRMLAMQGALAQEEPLPADERLLENDLQQAAVSLCPQIGAALDEARLAGAATALVSGSGPTVLGLFPGGPGVSGGGLDLAERAAERLQGRVPAAVAARPVGAAFARVVRHNPAGTAKRRAV
ncbi:MAG: 4-(cytidine 5-diphospho)-2-C-methyl-D-erythritol kinase [Solirubrobacterales bacterium]|nr:4-(cytidine 5-diphospho)-2-C-methyl-D-erythritol kinase [Solirubrobacterales bacterium]